MTLYRAGGTSTTLALAALATVFCIERCAWAVEPPDGLQVRIAHLQRHLEQASARRFQAARADAPDALLLAEVERNIANTLTDLSRGHTLPATQEGSSQEVVNGPLLTAQLEAHAPPQEPSPPRPALQLRGRWQPRPGAVEENEQQAEERVVQRRVPQRIERDERRRFEQEEGRGRSGGRVRSAEEAETRQFHLRAAAHHLRLAGMGDVADRLTRGDDAEPQRGLPGGRIDEETRRRMRELFWSRQRGPESGESRERLDERRFEELEERVDDAIEDLEDRLEEIEEVVQGLERRNARRSRAARTREPAELPVDIEEQSHDSREQRFHETIRRFHELLQGTPSEGSVATQEQVEIDAQRADQIRSQHERLQAEREQNEAALNQARAEAERQRDQAEETRALAEQQRRIAEEAKQVAEAKAAEREREVSRLREQLRRESQKRMELEEKLSEMERRNSENEQDDESDDDQ